MTKRTKAGNVTAEARQQHGMGKGKKFPVFDEQSAAAAIKLRGHAKSASERAAIINRAAQYKPAAAAKARKADAKK